MDCGSCLKGCVGGEIENMTELTAQIRQELMDELGEKARRMGANAIVGISFETNSVFEGTNDMVIYGTAVKVLK